MIATAGRNTAFRQTGNAYIRDFLPGSLCSKHAAVVISNGGSSTGYQAISHGTPVLGIPSNLDQYLCMQVIEKAEAGIMLRSDTLSSAGIKKALETLLENKAYALKAGSLRDSFLKYKSPFLFHQVILKAIKERIGSHEELRMV